MRKIRRIVTDKQRAFIRHALGLRDSSIGYRNRYLAGGKDIAIGRQLERKGMAIEGKTEATGSVWFVITEAGFLAVKKPGEAMDREEAERMARINERLISKKTEGKKAA